MSVRGALSFLLISPSTDFYTSPKSAQNILGDDSHPYNLFDLLPSGRRYRRIASTANGFKKDPKPKTATLTSVDMH